MAAKLQEIGLERGWGDTVASTLDTMHLLGELLQVRWGCLSILGVFPPCTVETILAPRMP